MGSCSHCFCFFSSEAIQNTRAHTYADCRKGRWLSVLMKLAFCTPHWEIESGFPCPCGHGLFEMRNKRESMVRNHTSEGFFLVFHLISIRSLYLQSSSQKKHVSCAWECLKNMRTCLLLTFFFVWNVYFSRSGEDGSDTRSIKVERYNHRIECPQTCLSSVLLLLSIILWEKTLFIFLLGRKDKLATVHWEIQRYNALQLGIIHP